ncbi:TetR family transcriptional regulator [Rhodobacteraceae bacterium EhC02]|nr:TetR family transcriptional regulator [Rhodobacteraceae bacterium EhC02]
MPRKPTYDRNETIARARDLFWQQGWAGTSLKDLEAVLQMKPGSFYAAFGSKDALYRLALEKYASDGLDRLDQLARTLGPLESLQRFPQMVIGNDNAPAKACMLSKTLLELQAQKHPLAHDAHLHLLRMESRFAELFAQAQQCGEISGDHDPAALARRYQSDLLGLRVSAERDGIDAAAIAAEIAEGLTRL